ncbi:MAG: phenylalanine--tRNA ligase subunit beta [Acidimicrobiales bacterium]
MKVLLSWLRDFAPFEGDPVDLGEQLSDLGLAVESLDHVGQGLDGVVVARVLATRPHPNADKVHLVDVDVGDGEALQIVCGALNMAEGDLVPLATVGTTMPDGMEIGRRKLRGEWSNGMLCSSRELTLGDDHAGIFIAPGDLPVGAPFAEAMRIERDVLYDLEVNPNRPDAMSVAGVARDLAGRLGLPFQLPTPKPDERPAQRLGDVTVEILDADLCGRFTVRVLRGIQIVASDPLIARRLTLCGMRPVNSVVDASNYVMLELGQPSHPYDLSRVRGPGFRVRRAHEGETVKTLDGAQRRVTADDLLICDAEDSPVGVGGVMGGADSEIDDATTDVLLEMAWFRPMAIATTARRLKLRSEASARFEKGCDPEVIELAHARFAELVGASGAWVEAGIADRRGELPDRSPVFVRTDRVNRLLGSKLAAGEMVHLLESIGFGASRAGDTRNLKVTIPSWRYDSSTEIDVIEEIARLHGYSRLGRTLSSSVHPGSLTRRQKERRRLRMVLVGLGLSEAMPLPFLAPGELARCGLPDDGIAIANPLVAEESVLRTSLLPGLVGALATNAARRNTGVGLWEIGHVYRQHDDADGELPDEREWMAAALAGRDAAAAVEVWRAVEEALAVPGVKLANAEVPGLHPTRAARLVGPDGKPLGSVGEVDPTVLERHGIGERAGWLEVDLDVLLDLPHGETIYQPISRYPSSDIDLAFEVDDAVAATDIEHTLREQAGGRLAWVRLFDVYRGPGIAAGCRSLAYAMRLEALDHTLTDDEVGQIRQRCIAAVESAYPATLRG